MSEIDINKVFVRRQGNMPPIREVKLNEDDLKLSYWQREAECQKNWCEHYKQLSERYKQAIRDIKDIAESNIDDKQIIAVQIMLNGNPDVKNEVLKQIIQKCEEVKYE